MMFTSKSTFFLVFLVSLCPAADAMRYGSRHEYHFERAEPSVGATLLALGFLAAAGYGLYKVCDWLCTPSHEQIIKDSSELVKNARRNTDQLRAFFSRKALPKTMMPDEPLLYEWCGWLQQYRMSIDTVLTDISNALASLERANVMILQRLSALKNTRELSHVITHLEDTHRESMQLLNELESIHRYIKEHRSYCILFEYELRFMNSHAQALHALEQYANNPIYLREALRVCVMAEANKKHSNYPYMHYIQMLTADCQALEDAMRRAAYNYSSRLSAAQMLLQKMQAICNMLLLEDAYVQEKRDYERARLEQERINAEKAKAAAAQAHAAAAHAQAYAMQQQAWELAKQNQLQAQHNQLQAEQNALIGVQTVLNVLNPPPAPEVHIYT